MSNQKPRRTARTALQREHELIGKAYDLVETQINQGTASSQVLTHFLKLASSREELEQQRLRNENDLLRAKVESLQSGGRLELLYESALNAMRSYDGSAADDEP